MKVRNHLAPVFLLLLLAPSILADDWPTYQHDNQRTGVTAEELRPPLQLQWKFDSPFPPAKGWALPVNNYGARKNKPNVSYDDAFRVIVAGDNACFSSSCENKVYAVDASTGELKWTFFTDAAPRLAPTYWKDRLYFGADDGCFYCVDVKDGSLDWKVSIAPNRERMLGQGRFGSKWPVRSGGIVENGIVYATVGLFPSEGIYLCAINAENGSFIWKHRLDSSGVGQSPSPQGYVLATDDSIYLTSRVAPTRWRKKDGKNIGFTTPFPEVKRAHEYRFLNGGSYAQIWNGRNLVFGKACILGYDPDQEYKDRYGRTLKGALLFNWFNARQAAFKNDLAFLATDFYVAAVRQDRLGELSKNECRAFEDDIYKGFRAARHMELLEKHETLSQTLGEEHPKVRSIENGPLKWGLPFWKKWLAARDPAIQKVASKCEWLAPVVATESMILSGNILYLGGESSVHALDAGNGKEIWKAEVGSRVRGLAVANGRLFVSTNDGNVHCFSRKKTPRVAKVLPERANDAYQNEHTSVFADVAEKLLREVDVKDGYCLIVGAGIGQLAFELAKRSDLTIHALDRDAETVRRGRELLSAAGVYGGRVCLEQGSLERLPFAPYIFNLVVDQSSFAGEPSPTPVSEVFRVTRPFGGVAYFGQPHGGEQLGRRYTSALSSDLLKELIAQNGNIESQGAWHKIERGRLPGVDDWSHNYGSPSNTSSSKDEQVKGPFGILWYGEPGPRERIDRHATPPMPLVHDGIMFTQGYDLLMAYDIYNGVKYWEKHVMGATRLGLPLGTSNMAVDADGLFVVLNDRECVQLHRTTGETLRTFPAPARDGGEANLWGWVARQGKLLYGSRSKYDSRRRRGDRSLSEGVFAIDVETGRTAWSYDGDGIDHDGIAIGGGNLFVVQRQLTEAEHQQAIRNTIKDSSVEDRKPLDRRGKLIEPDLRKLVVLDAASGEKLWQWPFNATDITLDDVVLSKNRVGVACMYQDNVVVVHGTGSLGHPHREFLKGEFRRRALYALDSKSGKFLWGGRLGYRKRPVLVDGTIYAEPFAWNLRTGKPKMILNPLSGEEQKLDFHRGYVGCSHLLGSGAALFTNKNGISCFNLDDLSGYVPFGNMALSCGLNAVPANGVFVAPEGRSGCTCSTPIYTSIALYPKAQERPWGIGLVGGIEKVTVFPVKKMSINLGAPGFRQDASGDLWLPYPVRTNPGLVGKWLPVYQHQDSMCYKLDELTATVSGTESPWLYTSGYQFTKPLTFRLVDKGGQPARFTVRLFFAEPEDIKAGARVFSVLLQNKPALNDFDVMRESGGVRKAIVKEFAGIKVQDHLVITLKPAATARIKLPVLSAVQAVREK